MGDDTLKNQRRRSYGRPSYSREVANALATTVFHPAQTIKVRMQLGQGPNFRLVTHMIKNEGISSFYKGLSAALLRQVTDSAVSRCSFKYLARASPVADGGNEISLRYHWLLCSTISKTIGAIMAYPADLAATRMQGDTTLPSALRRNYKNVFHALYQAASREGISALWRGAGTNALGFMAMRFGALSSLEGFKIFRKHIPRDDGMLRYAYGSAGFLLYLVSPPACSKPFDYVKTQLQMMQPDANGRYPYAGALDCAKKTFRLGGPLKFYSGFVPYFFTLLPPSLLSYMLSERVFKGVEVSVSA
ncbi:OLC1v1007451C1 [Oldenlandia corymbosa var. corymbosa]|uniref:OLC1v1007451C1 n=1 Tax=Oldenlandia corymbosa var. corymbosa TaxID=529605 RepID=A0AAV1DLQ3_OLDCO|nr:OLC1v1007451C1 [Oldenlandia corymbosa var. corymbosa]